MLRKKIKNNPVFCLLAREDSVKRKKRELEIMENEKDKKSKIKISKTIMAGGAAKNNEPLIILKDIAKTYGKEELFSDARMRVMPQERIAIVGPNGIGKTTLLKIILGLEDADEGAREPHRAARIGYLPQETKWESLANSVFDEIHSANPEMKRLMVQKSEFEEKEKNGKLSEVEADEYLKLLETFKSADGYRYEGLIERLLLDFGFAKEAWGRAVASLSGGERTKLALAKVVLDRKSVV